MTKELLERFPALQGLDADSVAILEQSSRVAVLPVGARPFEAGMECSNYLMVANGRIRVQQVSESGREIVLYRVGAGETCVLTTACLLAHESYSAEAIAETEVTALVVPRAAFDRLLASSKSFRDFVFLAYASRITDLMLLVEEVAFGHMDIRLAQRLLELSDRGDSLAITHQDLAVELGTAREVISRQLKEFERRGWIRLERGRIEIVDRDELRARAHEDGV
ncbi:MAG: Crp/Fnr family transcriptional regulator [Rhodospirillaceae bacterium]|jgi:CRP/FNR family transcriptional regulator|nr:Crp/Fnr family transcriptional regulator [Rhodospirillaceae bacterium]